mmetsp:Transcript_43387/g.125422  ORF Transcript_43387/g.125422 Transcript_43387/m.125422 type:complete len:262 (-) Transcript_43387:21-806(-)
MVEGPKVVRKKDMHLETVTEVIYLRRDQRVVVWEEFGSDGQKPMWLRKGDIGTVMQVDEDGATISFQGRGPGGSSLPVFVKRRNWTMLRSEADADVLGKRLRAQRPAGEEPAGKRRATTQLPSMYGQTPASASTAEPAKTQKAPETEKPLTEEEKAKRKVAEEWLKKGPKKGVVRYTFKADGPLGLRFSKDVPPWILAVNDGSPAARKAPRVPLGGIVIAVNGYELTEKNCQEAMQGLKKRPVVLDIDWPCDQELPVVCRA